MLSLFTKDDTWFVIRIPSTQIKTKATDKTSFIFDLVQGDFIVTANTNSVRYAMERLSVCVNLLRQSMVRLKFSTPPVIVWEQIVKNLV